MTDRRPSGTPPAKSFEPPPTDPGLNAVTERESPSGGDPMDPMTATARLTAVSSSPRDARRAPVRTSLHPGVLLDGRYQLQQHVSDRGEVQLWRGEDRVLARQVAIRLLIDDGLPTALESTRQLLDAARRSGQLVHNGAASTYDATTTDADGLALAYVVSEWVHGISLLDLLRDGPLVPQRAASVLLSVSRVIAAAHAVGVTHGDLHPGDVIITSHGLIKVLDLETRGALGHRTPAERRSSDITGLGALLYASLTGKWPLGGGRGLPPAEVDASGFCRTPRQLRAGVPRELDALAMAALVASDHPQPSAMEMVHALELIVAELPTGSQPALDDDPEADTPAVQTAKAAQAERMARATAARRRTTRRRVLPVALLVLLALAAWLVGVAVGRLPGHSPGKASLGSGAPAKTTGSALTLNTVSDFDPLGDTVENPTQVRLADDNNPSTSWHTERYSGSQWGGNPVKTGVGLKVDLGRAVSVSQVRLTFTQPGVSVELRYNDQDSASLDSYTVAATSPSTHQAAQTLTPRGVGAYRYWLIWLTALPQTSTNPNAYEASLAEMKFFG